jgi:hypothetical protein
VLNPALSVLGCEALYLFKFWFLSRSHKFPQVLGEPRCAECSGFNVLSVLNAVVLIFSRWSVVIMCLGLIWFSKQYGMCKQYSVLRSYDNTIFNRKYRIWYPIQDVGRRDLCGPDRVPGWSYSWCTQTVRLDESGGFTSDPGCSLAHEQTLQISSSSSRVWL